MHAHVGVDAHTAGIGSHTPIGAEPGGAGIVLWQ
jgi:hypothetical protein